MSAWIILAISVLETRRNEPWSLVSELSRRDFPRFREVVDDVSGYALLSHLVKCTIVCFSSAIADWKGAANLWNET